MLPQEIKEKMIEAQVDSFKEFINQSCRDIAMCCRATSEVAGDVIDCKQFVSSCAQQWFDEVEGLSDAEFNFIAHKEVVKKLIEEGVLGESDETDI